MSLSAFLIATCLTAQPGDADAGRFDFFERTIRPLLASKCYRCHSTRAGASKGGLVLDSAEGLLAGGSSGAVVVPGRPEESLLLRAVRRVDPDLQMPPKEALEDSQIAAIETWIAMGAPDPRRDETSPEPDSDPTAPAVDLDAARQFWAFRAPSKHAPPDVERDDWPRSDIDRFVLARQEMAGVSPARDADRAALLRRVTFALTGLPPTPDEVRAFLGDDSARAFEDVVDRLLASPHFGERWGRHWLDVARYGESTGRTRNFAYPHAWRYRNWVIEAFNDDVPFDRFIVEQLAGDLLADASPAGASESERDALHVATAFLALGTRDLNERNREQYAMDNVDEQIDVTSRGFLALTVSCARCHDHKFDPISQADYYAMAGIFRSTETLCGLTNRRGGGQNYRDGSLLIKLEGDGVAAAARTPSPETKRQLRELERRAGLLKRRLEVVQAAARGRADDAAGRDATAGDGDADARLTRVEARQLLPRLRRQLSALEDELGALKDAQAGSFTMGVRDGRVADCNILVKGEVGSRGPSVPRGIPRVIASGSGELENRTASGRLELARWIASSENPLTARVMANRIWLHLFGRGLVPTVDNFGETGARPTHPELLDWLAVRFVELGWSVKKLIREIVLSRVYGLSSEADEANLAVDPDNVLLWRSGRRRLEVEAIRDAMLAASGALDRTPGAETELARAGGDVTRQLRSVDLLSGNVKRSVYLPVVRDFVPEMFEVFDFAEPSMVKGQRDVTTVAPQALFLMNSEFVLEQAGRLAKRVLDAGLVDDSARLELAYVAALGRAPTAAESSRALEYLDATPSANESRGETDETMRERWSRLCHALLACAEFRYVE